MSELRSQHHAVILFVISNYKQRSVVRSQHAVQHSHACAGLPRRSAIGFQVLQWSIQILDWVM
jgi:hypothetical protein